MVNFFIIAHACKLRETFVLGNNKLIFKGPDNEWYTGDTTQLDLDKDNYHYEVTQRSPLKPPNDYILIFDDLIQEFDMNTFGVFREDNNRVFRVIDPNRQGQVKLSQIIEDINSIFGRPNNFYLQICRKECQYDVGGKSTKKYQNKKRTNKKRTNKKRIKRTYRK
jgi:hypothetical protein